eukprot:2780886-Pyramimonas_sp.AAC.2
MMLLIRSPTAETWDVVRERQQHDVVEAKVETDSSASSRPTVEECRLAAAAYIADCQAAGIELPSTLSMSSLCLQKT